MDNKPEASIQETGLTTTEESKQITVNSEKAAASFFGGNGINMWTSIPASDKFAQAAAMGDADFNLRDYFKSDPFAKPIEMVHALAHGVVIVNDDGEEVPAGRVVIVDKDGKTYSTVAEGARSSLGNLFSIFGLPPFNPPLSIIAKEVKTRKGFYTLNIKPIRLIEE
jgi:hypothetical protein